MVAGFQWIAPAESRGQATAAPAMLSLIGLTARNATPWPKVLRPVTRSRATAVRARKDGARRYETDFMGREFRFSISDMGSIVYFFVKPHPPELLAYSDHTQTSYSRQIITLR